MILRLVHCDVDNENLHGAWFEEKTGEHNLLAQMFIDANQSDPNVKLFISNFKIVKAVSIQYLFDTFEQYCHGMSKTIV